VSIREHRQEGLTIEEVSAREHVASCLGSRTLALIARRGGGAGAGYRVLSLVTSGILMHLAKRGHLNGFGCNGRYRQPAHCTQALLPCAHAHGRLGHVLELLEAMLASLAPYLAAGSTLGEHVFQIMLAFFLPSFCGGTCSGAIREYTCRAAATGDYRRGASRRGAGATRHCTQPVTPYAVKLLGEAAWGCGWLVHPRVLLQAACLLLGCLGCLDTLHSVHKGEAVDGCEAHDAELQASRCAASLVPPVLSC
jgi:hypothetical protein